MRFQLSYFSLLPQKQDEYRSSCVVGDFLLFRHELSDLVRKLHRILRQDALDEQRLRVEQAAVILELLAVLARVMQRLQAAEELVVRIDLEDAFRLEERVLHIGECLLHRERRTRLIRDEADSA